MTLRDLIISYRSTHRLSQRQFASQCGLSNGYISMIEKGENPKTKQPITPTLQKLNQLAIGMGMTMSDLFATVDDTPVDLAMDTPNETSPIPDGYEPMPNMDQVPVIGQVACGEPITAEENIEGYTSLPSEWNADFILICRGQSMEPKIKDGDAVAIRRQKQVENGQIAAVRIENDATLKKVYRYPDRLELRPINSDYESIVLYGQEMNTAAIEGRAVGLCRGL